MTVLRYNDMTKIIRKLFPVVTVVVLTTTACSSDDTIGDPSDSDDNVALSIDVAETDWHGETVNITSRAGETIDGLKATSGAVPSGYGHGFSLHGVNLLGAPSVHRQVTWNSSTGQWNSGNRIYWKRTSGSETFNVYAYAPYKTEDYTYREAPTFPSTTSPETWNGKITFTANEANGTNVDLLYAGATVKRSDGLAQLTFRHAMAKLSLGTITNSTGETVTLNSLALSGSLYPSGTLTLYHNNGTSGGTWSPAAATAQNYIRSDFDPDTDGNQTLTLTNGQVKSLNIDPFILIPGPTVTITLTFSDGKTYSFTTTLEQGKDKTYNITVQKNFEVVIDWS